jgi:hypothetical protein
VTDCHLDHLLQRRNAPLMSYCGDELLLWRVAAVAQLLMWRTVCVANGLCGCSANCREEKRQRCDEKQDFWNLH